MRRIQMQLNICAALTKVESFSLFWSLEHQSNRFNYHQKIKMQQTIRNDLNAFNSNWINMSVVQLSSVYCWFLFFFGWWRLTFVFAASRSFHFNSDDIRRAATEWKKLVIVLRQKKNARISQKTQLKIKLWMCEFCIC